KLVRLDRHDVHRIRVVRIHLHGKAEIRRQTLANVVPRSTGIVAAINAPVMLEEHSLGIRWMVDYFVHALAPLRILLVWRQKSRTNSFVARLPVPAAIFGAID